MLVHLSLRGSESTDAWTAVCEDIAARGVRAPQLCIIDGSKGLRAAVERTWHSAEIQRCAVHKLRNLLTAAPKRLHDELRLDYHAIIRAEDGASARRAYTAFVKKWTKGCPGAVKSLEEAGAELLTPPIESSWVAEVVLDIDDNERARSRREIVSGGSLERCGNW